MLGSCVFPASTMYGGYAPPPPGGYAPHPYGAPYPPPGGYAPAPGAYHPPPSTYQRMAINWADAYDRRRPFVVPYGVPPDVAYRMQRASDAFRAADRDFSGNLDLREFPSALGMLGSWANPMDMTNIFYMIDQDRSGKVNEREFVEYWGYHGW